MGRSYDGKDDVWALGCMLGGAVTGKLVEARSTGVFALDPEAVKALIDETNAASARFGCLVTTMLAKNPMVRPAAQGVEWALATGASVFEGGAAIVEEEDEDEAEAEQRRRVAQDMASMSLFDACKNGRTDVVQVWLDSGADANSPTDAQGRTPLYIACENGHVDAARLLLEKGAAVDRAMKDGTTPLYIACMSGHVDAVRLVLAKGAEVDRAREGGFTPLYIACGNGHVDAARLLLKEGADVNRANEYGRTPLFAACYNGHVDVTRLLLDNGAAVDRAQKQGATPLFITCVVGHIDLARLLLEKGAEVDRATNTARGRTPLSIAKQHGHSSIVALLEEHQKPAAVVEGVVVGEPGLQEAEQKYPR